MAHPQNTKHHKQDKLGERNGMDCCSCSIKWPEHASGCTTCFKLFKQSSVLLVCHVQLKAKPASNNTATSTAGPTATVQASLCMNLSTSILTCILLLLAASCLQVAAHATVLCCYSSTCKPSYPALTALHCAVCFCWLGQCCFYLLTRYFLAT